MVKASVLESCPETFRCDIAAVARQVPGPN